MVCDQDIPTESFYPGHLNSSHWSTMYLEGTYRFSHLKVLADLCVDLFNIQKEKMHQNFIPLFSVNCRQMAQFSTTDGATGHSEHGCQNLRVRQQGTAALLKNTLPRSSGPSQGVEGIMRDFSALCAGTAYCYFLSQFYVLLLFFFFELRNLTMKNLNVAQLNKPLKTHAWHRSF